MSDVGKIFEARQTHVYIIMSEPTVFTKGRAAIGDFQFANYDLRFPIWIGSRHAEFDADGRLAACVRNRTGARGLRGPRAAVSVHRVPN